MSWRRCSGCGERGKENYCPLQGGGYYCIDCARDAGVTGSRPRNRAEANSAAWKQGRCTHPATETRRYQNRSKTGMVRDGWCPRCSRVVWGPVVDN